MPKLFTTLQTIYKKSLNNRVVKVFRVTPPSTKIFRKSIVTFLIVTIALENLLVPLAYAQDAAPDAEVAKEEFTTLITDTELEGTDPYVGEGRGVNSVIPALTDLRMSNGSASVLTPSRVHKLAKENYRPNEEIKVVIDNGLNKEFKTEFIDAIGNKVAMETTEIETGAAKVITVDQPSSFRPGKYTLRISDGQGGVSEQDFTWGVLAVNPDKSVYSPNETAKLAFGVLDEGGNMVCDAQVELQITDPAGRTESLSTDNGKIRVNEECQSHDFTLNPDYDAEYEVGGAGAYKMLLKAQTKNGAYSITDSFEVRDSVPFDVKRVTATRIYPPNAYPVTMEIIANQDFEGTITETVPASFRIAPQGSEIKTENQKIEEQIEKQGEEQNTSSWPSPGSTSPSDTSETDSGQARVTATPTPAPVQAPDNLPKAVTIASAGVLPYNTINNIQESLGGPTVLGASIPGLGMPFSGPFPISQEFGESLVTDKHDHDLYASFGMHGHDGVDFAMPEGTAITAVDSGKVLLAGDGDYGITVVIEHSWGRSYYGHLSSVDVKEGQEVSRGATIAKSGNTGISTGPHLHFGVKPKDPNTENGYYGKVDPAYYLGLKQSAGQVLGVAAKLASVEGSSGGAYEEMPNQTVDTDVKVLTWKVNVKKGDKISIGYSYLAPRISPQFYTLGPATFTDTQGKEVFHEIRKWQIASDALDYKFKRGSFTKSISTNCAAPCTQSVAGVGFKPKAVILEWTNNTAESFSTHQLVGMGMATASSSAGVVSERSVSYCSEDAITTTDTSSRRSNTKAVMMQSTDCATGTAVVAEADMVSFDNDGFTLNWTTNNTSAYILHYTAIGGADVSNTHISSFTLSTSAGAQSVAEPGFQPDFLMFLSTDTTAVNTNSASGVGGSMNIGFTSGVGREGSTTMWSDDNLATTDSRRQQRTDASIALLTTTGTQDALASLTSFNTNGFTLNKSDAPVSNIEIFYLAIKGGQYDVGSFTQPTSVGEQTVTTGFRPSGFTTLAASTSATTAIQTTGAALSTGGASRENSVPWCNDTTGVTCTAPGATITASQNTDWCNDTTDDVCNSSWVTRKKISFNNTASSSDLTNFPVLVKLNSSRIDYSKTMANGEDLRFVDPNDPTVVLPHEIESWNESGDSYVWVKVPTVTGGVNSDYIWMYYNNSAATDGQDVANVWDSTYAGVWHLKEDPSVVGTDGFVDSTSNANHGTDNGSMISGNQMPGVVGGSIQFDGSNDYIAMPDDDASLDPVNISVSSWVYLEEKGDYSAWMSRANGSGWDMSIDETAGFIQFEVWTGSWDTVLYDHDNLALNTWYHISGTYDGSNVKMFVNGNLVGTTPASGNITYSNNSQIFGADASGTTTPDAGTYWQGRLDEVRISNDNRSDDWIKASYVSQSDNMNAFGSEITYGQGTTTSSGWSERKKITFNNSASAENLTNFPVLVKLDSSRIDYSKTQNAGQDIRFVDPSDPNTVLSHEIETWNESGDSFVWVKVPQLDAGSRTDHIWMYYGNSSTNDGQDADSVWDSSFKAVWHLNESSGTSLVDSTVNANTATKLGATEPAVLGGGKIAGGQTFDGSNDTAEDGAVIGDSDAVTLSGWFKASGAASNQCIAGRGLDTFGGWNICLQYSLSGGNNRIGFTVVTTNPSTTQYSAISTTNLSTGTWYHATGVWDPGVGLRIHLNGAAPVTTATTSTSLRTSSKGVIMGYGRTASGTYFPGDVDELRISNIVRSADWIEAEYISTNDTMNTFGSAEVYGVGTQLFSQSSIWSDDVDNFADSNTASSARTDTVIQFGTSPPGTGASRTVAKASVRSFDPTGVTLSWSEADSTARQVLYWAVGSVTASQEDYRWYKNANSVTPGAALEDENSSTIVAKNKPYARLRANLAVGGNGLNASSQGFKLQYAAAGSQASVGGVSDWCNDTTGVTCTAPATESAPSTTPTDWCNDTTGVTCNSSWTSRKKITFDNSDATTALTNFPVLVKLDSTRINYAKTQNNGEDLRFVDPSDPTVALNHEIETWNESGTSYVWVKVPSVDAQSATDAIWMYYGNSTVGSPATQLGNATHATGVWDGSTVMVQHLEEASGCSSFSDSTANAHNGTCINAPTINTSGKIGTARSFDGTDDGIRILDNAAFEPGAGAQTIHMWVNVNSFAGDYQSLLDHAGSGGWSFFLGGTTPYGTCNVAGELCYYENSGDQGGGSTISASTWVHVAAVKSGTNVTFYTNGVQSGSITITNPVAETEDVIIGQSNFSTGVFGGIIDEVRYASTARSADWMRATFLTENDQFNAYGSEFSYAETQQSSSGWGYRKQITLNNSASAENLIDFPVLVKLDSSKIDYTKTQDDGGDIRFVDPADRTTVLSHEIESWNENGTSYVWVKVPQVDAGSTSDSIFMYYGNPGASDGQDVTGVWNSGYVAVYHANETSGQNLDATANNNDATTTQVTQQGANIGKINGADDFDGTDDYVRSNDAASLGGMSALTVESWVKPDVTPVTSDIISYKNNSGSPAFGWQLLLSSTNVYFEVGTTGTSASSTTASLPTVGSWNHVATVFESGQALKPYLNGVYSMATANTPTGNIIDSDSHLYWGGGFGTAYLDGKLDEMRVSNVARSADWVEATYLTGTDAMNVFGQEQPYTSGGTATTGWTDVADVWCNDTSGVVCNTSWSNRKRITINNQSSTTALTNFPVLVKLDSTRIDYTKTQDDGDDIRFVDPANPTEVLSHEIESWNESGESFVWVEVPQLDAKSATDSIWMYYGNASTSSGQDVTGTWDGNFQVIQHLKEDPAGSAPQMLDSTSNNRDGTSIGSMTLTDLIPAKVNGGLDFDGTDDNISISDFYIQNQVTLSAWVWRHPSDSDAKNWANAISKWTGDAVNDEWVLGMDEGMYSYWIQTNSARIGLDTAIPIPKGEWIYMSMTYNGSTLRGYVNGVEIVSQAVTGTITNSNQPMLIGRNAGFSYWQGKIDEVRVSDTARSVDWMRAEYQTSADQMNTYGPEETQTSSLWKFKDNSSISDRTTITSSVLGTSTTGNQMTYQESNITALNPTAIAVGEKREFDFSLDGTNASARRTYYFRIVNADGTPLTSYTRYPAITIGVPNQKVMRGGKFFNYKQSQPFSF